MLNTSIIQNNEAYSNNLSTSTRNKRINHKEKNTPNLYNSKITIITLHIIIQPECNKVIET
jgi:hypothetical protein